MTRRPLPAVALLCAASAWASAPTPGPQAKPGGEMRWALYVTVSRTGSIEPALMLIDPYPWSAPLEEVRLKQR